jgi:1,5-anhydro-D-fructose reductase (1,5-anhydro-D-mannitol-forming)
MTLGIALMGTGRIAATAFVPAVQAVDDAHLVAVLSRDPARGDAFAREHGIPQAYHGLDTLLKNPQVEAVIVATPDVMHESQVIAAADAGKQVLCEKPMTSTVAGCNRMAEAVRASGITFAMGYNNRFNTGLQRIKAMLEDGAIGSVRYARALLTTQVQDPSGWRALGEQSRYWAMSATGTHLIDCFRWYFGDPDSVGGVMAAPVNQGPNDDLSTLILNYPGRLLAELTASAVFRSGNRLELYGETGSIIGEDVFGARANGLITCNGQVVAYEAANPFTDQLRDFVEAVRQQRPPQVTLEDGVRNVRIMEAVRERPLLTELTYATCAS